MFDVIQNIMIAFENAGSLIAKPITVGLFLIFTWQGVKALHYMVGRPFPARIGYGGLVLFSITEAVVRVCYPNLVNITDMFLLIFLVLSKHSSLMVLFDLKVSESFYIKMQQHTQWAGMIIGGLALGLFVYIYADRELAVRYYTNAITAQAVNTGNQLVKKEEEKNQILKEDTAFKKKIISSLSVVSGEMNTLKKRSDTAKQERKELLASSKKNYRKINSLNKTKPLTVGKLDIKTTPEIEEGNKKKESEEKKEQERKGFLKRIMDNIFSKNNNGNTENSPY